MSDIRKYMKIVAEGMRNGMVKVELRDEPVFINYYIDGDQIEWVVDGLDEAGTRALNITPDEAGLIEDACADDMNFSEPEPRRRQWNPEDYY